MRSFDWFTQMLRDSWDIEVDESQIGYESVVLNVNEIDPLLIPFELTEGLPKELLFDTFIYVDAKGRDWLGILGKDTEIESWYLQVIVRDGKLMASKRLERELTNGARYRHYSDNLGLSKERLCGEKSLQSLFLCVLIFRIKIKFPADHQRLLWNYA